MLNPDKPITKRGEDFLNRKVFADNISKAIINYGNRNDSLTVGLYGKWGSGKTSIVNMIVEKLGTDKNIVIFKFEPWIYSDTQQLISHFFREFANVVKHKDYAKDAMKIGEELETYASFFEPMSLIPEPTTSLISLASSKVFGSVGKAAKKWGKLKTKSLSATKESIEKHLLKLDKKILIVIDDIDRLNNTEIRQIFQMIKVLGNFPNTVYLTVMDREVVADALSDVQKGDGSEYLEKIIHVPFEVTMISHEHVIKYLISNANKLFNETETDEQYLGNVFHSGIKHFFKTIRDVNRFMNVLKFNFYVLGKELNAADIMAITALQVFEPKVYDMVRNNKRYFVSYIIDLEKDLAKKELENIFNSFENLTYKKGKEFLEVVFPNIITILGQSGFVGNETSYRKAARVCSEDFFDVYFQMHLDEKEIFNPEMKQYIDSTSDEKEFRKTIELLQKNGRITRFLDRLQDFTEKDIPEKSFQIIFDVLFDMGDQFPKIEPKMFVDGNDMKVLRIVYQLAQRIENKEDRFILFEHAIKNSKNSIWISCFEVMIQMQAHGEWGEEGRMPEDKQTLTYEKLQELKQLVQMMIEEWIQKHRLFEHTYSRSIWSVWQKLDKKNAEKYRDEQLKDNNQLLNVLEKYITIRRSYGSNDYVEKESEVFGYENLKNFVESDMIVEQVKEIRENFDKYQTKDKSKFVIDEFLKHYASERSNA